MYAPVHKCELVGSTLNKDGEAVPRLALAARGVMLLNAERAAGKIATERVANKSGW